MVAKPPRPASTARSLPPSRSLPPARRRPARAPLVVVDAAGVEAGVLVDWAEYVALLALLAAPLALVAAPRRPIPLPAYWRRAIQDCSVASLGGPRAS